MEPIVTARLVLRPLSLHDVPRIFVLGSEAGMRRWIPDQVYRDEAHAEAVVRALVAHAVHRDPAAHPFVLGVELRETGELVGHVGLSAARGSVEIGYAIEERLQGRGYATEAVVAMARFAIDRLALGEVLGIVDAQNAASIRVLEKAGFGRTDRGSVQQLVFRYV